jgi:hypothetical protein
MNIGMMDQAFSSIRQGEGVGAGKGARSLPLAGLIEALAKVEREGTPRNECVSPAVPLCRMPTRRFDREPGRFHIRIRRVRSNFR